MSELRWILLGCGVLLLLGIYAWGRRSRGQAATDDDFRGHGRIDPPMTQQAAAPSAVPAASEVEPLRTAGNRWHDEEWTSTVADLPEIRLDSPQEFEDPLAADVTQDDLLVPLEEGVATEPNLEDPLTVSRLSREAAPAVAPSLGPSREPALARPKVADKRKIVALRLSAVLPDRYSGSKLRAALEGQGLKHGRYGIFHRLDGSGASILSVASMVEPGAFDLVTMADANFAGVTIFALLPGPQPAAATCEQLFNCARQLEQALGGVLHDDRGALLTPQRMAAIRDEVLDFEHLLGGHAAGPAGLSSAKA